MPLQDIIIEKINNYCGKTIFINTLKEIKLCCDTREQQVIDNAMMYYNLMFNIIIDHENDVIRYRSMRQNVLDVLTKKYDDPRCHQNDFILFFIELINYGDTYITGLRRLIS